MASCRIVGIEAERGDMGHPNLSNEINANIAQSEKDGGIWLKDVPIGGTLLMRTKSRMYRIVRTDSVVEPLFTVEGHPHYCPKPTAAFIHGSTWGGSMLKIGFIGKGMHLEFSTKEHRGITTTQIEEVELL